MKIFHGGLLTRPAGLVFDTWDAVRDTNPIFDGGLLDGMND